MTELISSFTGEYAFLSNFYPSPIYFDGNYWATAEHLFQAYKTFDQDERDAIRLALSPGAAKRLGRKATLRPDWEEVKDLVMWECLRLKFNLSGFAQRLVETGNAYLVEGNHWGDAYWGVCSNGVGENRLGQLLMALRSELAPRYKLWTSS